MRKLALAGLAASLTIAAASVSAQEAPRLDVPPAPGPAAPNPNDPYPYPPPPQAQAQVPARPKITGGLVAEAGGGVAGGLLAKGVGTAAAGPVGGFAASWIGSNLGGRAVHMVRRLFHRDKSDEPARQAAAAPEPPQADAPS